LKYLNQEFQALTLMPSKFVDWQTSQVIYFKEDPVYLKKYIVELHTEERWRRDGR